MLIYIIRHGETAANRAGLLQGHADNPLLEEGIRMAAVVGEALSDVRFDAAFSSPLVRAMDTARAVLEASGNADVPIRTDERLLEVNMGIAEGMRYTGSESQLDPELSRSFLEGPGHFPGFPGGEDLETLCERTQGFLSELAGMDFGTVLVSTHGCAMRAMLNGLTDDPSDFWRGHIPYNCSVSIVEVEGESGIEAGDAVEAAEAARAEAARAARAAEPRMKLVGDDLILYDESLCFDPYTES